ncbi:MAG: hypothetical protein IKB25_07995 [Lentisphaeria bacterium]|nr:hypothetical protein [Lentisphaeria bacterium]
MEEKKITSAAAAEETIASIKKLMEAVGNDDELKQKLEDTLAALTGKSSVSKEEKVSETSSEENSDDIHQNEDEDEDGDEDEVSTYSSNTDFSDIFTEDAIAGMVVGFVAGAAVVGGGVLLHKLLK